MKYTQFETVPDLVEKLCVLVHTQTMSIFDTVSAHATNKAAQPSFSLHFTAPYTAESYARVVGETCYAWDQPDRGLRRPVGAACTLCSTCLSFPHLVDSKQLVGCTGVIPYRRIKM